MILFRRRLLVYVGLWLLAGLAFAFLPFPDEGYPVLQERLGVFLETPLLVSLGLATVWSSSSGLLFLAAALYLVGHGVATIFQPRRGPFYALCGVHVLQLTLAVVSFAWRSWHDGGG